ncbi:hypothetical protein GOODEAATRI_033756 [Goodea atripinnis]|uniref:Uncharacterized protein n=1 Tax=Goodea atripinnis TaxID=208336 RepID=A0ABV0MXC2_9TELE
MLVTKSGGEEVLSVGCCRRTTESADSPLQKTEEASSAVKRHKRSCLTARCGAMRPTSSLWLLHENMFHLLSANWIKRWTTNWKKQEFDFSS